MKTKKIYENNYISYAKKILGILLIIIGIIGLFLPFLQGIVMILLGVFLLGGKSMVARVKYMATQALERLRRIRR